MSAWLAIIKAGLPYVADIVADRLPVFTKRKDPPPNPGDPTAQQIAELQQAVQHNAESIKALAEQMQQTLKALEAAAAEQELLRMRIRSARRLAMIAFGFAFLAFGISVLSSFL
jgi:hypothetical protein